MNDNSKLEEQLADLLRKEIENNHRLLFNYNGALLTIIVLYGVLITMFFYRLDKIFEELHDWKDPTTVIVCISFILSVVFVIFISNLTSNIEEKRQKYNAKLIYLLIKIENKKNKSSNKKNKQTLTLRPKIKQITKELNSQKEHNHETNY